MTNDFNDLNLHPQLVQAVAELGYVAPMPIQAEMIPVMMSGRDVIGQAQTGTGKTAAFALPILNNLDDERDHVQALILTPTRELAMQVAQAFSDFGSHSRVRVLAVYGGQSYGLQIGRLKRGVDIVVGTPGRLMDLMDRKVLDISRIRTVVLDEADEMLSMGFVEDIEQILLKTPQDRQTALFSATMPAEIRHLAERYLNNAHTVTIQREHVTVDAIEQRYYLVNEKDKTSALTRLFEMEDITSALIFVRTRSGTGELANELTMRGYPAEALNGDMAQETREMTLNRFRKNQIKVLVATDVAARGLDIEDISHVFNYDLPNDPEIYVHRIGRTGRAGKTGISISLVTPSEKRRLGQIEAFARKKITRAMPPTEEDVRKYREQQLENHLMVWLKRGRCKQERALVEKWVEEGYDPIEIATAALKVARADEKQRPLDPMSEVVEVKPVRQARKERRPEDRGRPLVWSSISHEPGMMRLSLDVGRKDGIRPNDIVGAIAYHADIPGHSIGKILI